MCLALCLAYYRPLAECRWKSKGIKKCVVKSASAGRQVEGLTRDATLALCLKDDMVLAGQESGRKDIGKSMGEGAEILSSAG